MDAEAAQAAMLAGYHGADQLAMCPTCGSRVPPDRLVGVPVRVTESVAPAVERFDPAQPRDLDGKWTDGAGPGAAAAAVLGSAAGAADVPPAGDKLRLHGRIPLGPGERLVSSGKMRSENTDLTLQWATTRGPMGSEARIAAVDPDITTGDGSGRWGGDGADTARLNRRQLRRLRNDLDEAGAQARALAKSADRKYDAGEELTPVENGDVPVATGEVRGAGGVVRWQVWMADEGDYTTSIYTWPDEPRDGVVLYGRGSRRLVKQLDALDAELGAAEAADGMVDVGADVDVERTVEAVGVPVRDRHAGRVLEALDPAPSGQRRYRVQVIAYGDSKNGRRYPPEVMRAACALYSGAKAFDHHRSEEELRSGTIAGMVGHYSDVVATESGIEATLTLLPSATHAAEVLDAALAQPDNPHAAGISHDVQATFRPISENGRHLAEATAIVGVMSADIVSHPAAGGLALRAVAGGIDLTTTDEPGAVPGGETEESDVTVTTEGVLAALQTATPEQLAAVGLARADTVTETTEPPAVEPARETAPTGEPKGSFLAGLMIGQKLDAAGLGAAREAITAALPARITEADIDAQVAAYKTVLAGAERAGLVPTAAVVTQESADKKRKALDAFFDGDWRNGYRSFREAYLDFTGHRPRSFDEDLNRLVLRESFGGGYAAGTRATESGNTATWAQALGDSVTRRMLREYSMDNLSTWRRIVRTMPVADFRTQRHVRIGGYGTLPTVAEGGPYQPLTTPGDEEATGALSKRGGTEDVTLEMIANDDVRAIQRIPGKLGRAAARTIYEFVWAFLSGNATCTFDSTALFHNNHANTDGSSALSQSTLSIGRRKMIEQTAYGDASEVLGLANAPKFLVVPPELEELAFQLTKSAVAVPSTPAGPSDTPNIHSANGLTPILVPSFSDADDWFLVADPDNIETITVGFYNGREEPELFTQAENNVGSVFNADVFTWKIRHIYLGIIEEYRGFYRGQGT